MPSGPEVQPGHSAFLQQIPMYPHRALALEEPYRMRHTVFWSGALAHMVVIRRSLSFNQFDAPLLAQLAQNSTYLRVEPSEQNFLSILRYDDNMAFAFPAYVRQTLPLMHVDSPSCPTRAS